MFPSLTTCSEETTFDKDDFGGTTFRHEITQNDEAIVYTYSWVSQASGETFRSEQKGVIAAVFPEHDFAKIRWENGSRSFIKISTRQFKDAGRNEVFYINIPETLVEGRTFLETAFEMMLQVSSRCCERALACALPVELIAQFHNALDGEGWSTDDNGASFFVKFGKGSGLLILLVADVYPFLMYYIARGLFNKNKKGGFRYNNISTSTLECSGYFDSAVISHEIDVFCAVKG